jgi:tetratricopeptide (TPR) repeat protein
MLAKSPDDSFLLFAIAKEYEKMDNLEKAMTTYYHLKKIDPDYIGLYYHLAKLHEEFSEPVEALKIYDEGIALAKKIADFHALSELNNARMNCEIEM